MNTTTKSEDPSTIRIENARLSFPALFEAKAFNDGKPAFKAVLILNKKTQAAQIAKIEATIELVKKEEWKGKAVKLLGTCLKDGAEKADLDGYGDEVVFVSASNPKRILVVDRARTPLTAEDGKPYAGCYVNATIRVWAQDNKFGKRINASLRAVQFYKDGEPFGEKPAQAEDEFENLGDDEGVV